MLDTNISVQVELTQKTITNLTFALCAPVLLWAIAMIIIHNTK